jgi:hypothetical protein
MIALLFAAAGLVSAVAYVLTRKSAPGDVSPSPVSSPKPAAAPEVLPDFIHVDGSETIVTGSTSGLRGFRNNNPGNIDWIADAKKRWRGMIRIESPAPGITPRFGYFDTPENGVRAISKELQLSVTRGAKTLMHLIAGIPQKNGTLADGWAPSNENESATYARFIAARMGVGAEEVIPIYDRLPDVVDGIIRFENGKNIYTPAQIKQWVYLP